MRQALGSASTPDRHYVTPLAGHRSSALACSFRTAAATFSYPSAAELLQKRPVQPSLQDVVLRDPPAILQAAVGSNGSDSDRYNGAQNQEAKQLLLPLSNDRCSLPAPPGQHLQEILRLQDVQQLKHPLHHSSINADIRDHNSDQSSQQTNKLHHHQQQQDVGRVHRQWSSMRNWQWLASQQQCTGGSSSLQDIVNIITQLSQPGVAPSHYDQQQQQGFHVFLAQLLQSATQRLLVSSSSGSSSSGSCDGSALPSPAAALASDVTDLLWGLAKLRVQPHWTQQQHHQQQQQQQSQSGLTVRRSPAVAAALLVRQRSAAAVDAAVGCLSASLSHQQQYAYSPRQLALCGWALAKLQYAAAAHQQFWQQCLAAVQQQLPAFSDRDLSNVIWALAKVQHGPDSVWTSSFLGAARQVLCRGCNRHGSSSGSGSGQSTAVIMLSLAQLGITPAAEWIDAVLLSTLQRQPVGQQLLPQQNGWQQQQQQQLGGLLLQYNGYALASILGAVAKWGHSPQQQWMQAVQVAIQQQLDKCSGHDTAQISWALATLATAAVAENAAAAPLSSAASCHSGSSSSSWDSDQQEVGLTMLRRQLLRNSPGSINDLMFQQQQQQQVPGCFDPELLQQLSQRLADSAHTTDPHQVVLGMWAVTKLHQVSQQAYAESSSSSSSSTSSSRSTSSGSSRSSTETGAVGAAASQLHLERDHAQQQRQYYSNSSSFQNSADRPSDANSDLLVENKQQYAGTEAGHWQGQQQRQHWQQCRKTLLHCISVLDQRDSIPLLDCKHLALLVWSLAAAGGQVDTGQQQQQQQQQDQPVASNNLSSRRHRTSSSSSSSGFSVPHQFVQQILSASRDSLAAGDPQSQVLLLRGLVNLGVQPSWQWLLRFYEATETQLNHSNATDLSMMAGALAQLNLRPLGSWLARFLQASTALAESRRFDAGSLVTVVAAVAGHSWGLIQAVSAAAAAPAAAPEKAGQQIEVLSPGWHAAVTQQTLLLLPQLSLLQISAMIRAAAALHWSSSCRECLDSLLMRALQLTDHHQQQQQQQQQISSSQNLPGQHDQQVVEVLQVMAAAAVLPVCAVPDSWWLHVATHLSGLCHLQQQEAAGLSPALLCAGTRALTAVLRQQQQQQQQQAVIACLQQLITAAAQQVDQLSVAQSLQVLSTAHHSLRFVRTARQQPDQLAGLSPGSPRPDSQADQGHTGQAAAAAAADWAAAQAEAGQQLYTAVQQFSAVVQSVLVQQVPHMGIQQLAAVLSVASDQGLMLPLQQDAGAAGTAATASPLLLVGLSVIGQQLHLVEQVQQQAMQQHQQLLEQRQQCWQSRVVGSMLLQQPRHQQQQRSSHIAGDLATLLAAFARCGYRPGSKLLRRMLRQVQLGLLYLDAHELSDVAAAAAALQLGKLLGRGFRTQYWMALSAALQRSVEQYSPVPSSTAAVLANSRQSGSRMHMQTGTMGRCRQSTQPAVAGRSGNHTSRVLFAVKALHDLTVPQLQRIPAHQCSGNSSSHSSSGYLQKSGTRGARGLGAPPSRALVERAFRAAAAVWSELASTRNRQAPQHRQQLQLLRLLVPLASRLSSSGLKQFTLVVGPQLRHLPGSERRKAWAVWKQMLAAWRIGKEYRQRLVKLQQQRKEVVQAQHKQEQQEQLLGLSNIDTETERPSIALGTEGWQPQQPAVVTVVS